MPDKCRHCDGTGSIKGRWWRPGPIAESRILGLRPSAGTFGVWSEALWLAATTGPKPQVRAGTVPVIGCDVATFGGQDDTAFHWRAGAVSLGHESTNGLDILRIGERLRRLARECAAWATGNNAAHGDDTAAPVDEHSIPIQIDDDATGRAVISLLTTTRHRVVPVNAASTPRRPDLYRKARDEVWFMASRKAAAGILWLGNLPKATLAKLELQALAPQWEPDAEGRRKVESKEDLQDPKRMGRSPDDMDALNLAYYEPPALPVAAWRDPAPSAPPGGMEQGRGRQGWDRQGEPAVRLWGKSG